VIAMRVSKTARALVLGALLWLDHAAAAAATAQIAPAPATSAVPANAPGLPLPVPAAPQSVSAAPVSAAPGPATPPPALSPPPPPPLPIDLGHAPLKPGQFLWLPEISPSGPMVIVVSIPEQKAYVYRNGIRIAVSTVSTGKKGHETPTGVFTILQKHKDHRSSLYNDAPMPWMQRLTWDGVALHAGKLPGYPASHGCVRLPDEFARKLFEVTDFGITVIIANDSSAPAETAHPGVFVPPIPVAGAAPAKEPRLSWYEDYRWRPDLSPDGPLTILLSAADRRVLVMRNGIEIGRARFDLQGKGPLGTQAYVLLEGRRHEPSLVVPERLALNWMTVALPGYTSGSKASTLDPVAAGRVSLPARFAKGVYDALQPGATLVVTDASVLPKTTGGALTVLASDSDIPGDEQAPPQE
jgi:hypothetical protein